MNFNHIYKSKIQILLLIALYGFVVGCGDLSGEESKERIRFTEFVLFPTSPYFNKSYIEIIPEDEAASLEIDFAAEILEIQEVYSAFIAAYLQEDMLELAKTFDTTSGIEYGTSTVTVYGWNNIKIYIEANWIIDNCQDYLNTELTYMELTDFYIRSKNVKAPWMEASAKGQMFYYIPGFALFPGGCYQDIGEFYFTKKSGQWRIHQIDGSKYFTDTEYKAP